MLLAKQVRTGLVVTLRILKKWGCSLGECATLLALNKACIRQFDSGKRVGHAVLENREFQERISLLLNIHAELRSSFSGENVYAWPQLVNNNEPFGGVSPLAFMIAGGLPAIRLTLISLQQDEPASIAIQRALSAASAGDGDQQNALDWLNSPHPDLGGITPTEAVETGGEAKVLTLIASWLPTPEEIAAASNAFVRESKKPKGERDTGFSEVGIDGVQQ